jgi:ATP-dependent RNA helicase DHR2
MNGDSHGFSGHKSKPHAKQTPTRNHINAAQHTPTSLAEKRRELLNVRKKLPIWPHADKIRLSLRGDKDVMLLVGETGSGKSTQVPQFLLGERWCTGCIAITQPRRVAAISLAKRVAEEMGTPLGSSSPASKVGYSVRFDTSVSPSTKVKFLTEGMLLQELLRDPWLKQYSAVIVDEVHERSVNVDLILGFLRNLVRGDKRGRDGRPLKVAVMSATADVQKLYDFFEADRSNSLLTPISEQDQDSASEDSWGGVSDEAGSAPKPNGTSNGADSNAVTESSDSTSICYIEGRQYPVHITYLSEPTQDFVEAALKAVFQIHLKEPLPGDILVFLTGQDTVEGLERLINEYAETMDPKLPKASSSLSICSVAMLTTSRS